MQTTPPPDLRAEIADICARVDARLDGLDFGGGPDPVRQAMREILRGPAKRLRPLMTILAARDLGVHAPAALEAGCAIELLHSASLLLDDLPCMDNALLRRGRSAVHLTHGEDVAMLAAITLLTEAYQLAATAPQLTAEDRVRLVTILTRSVGLDGLVGGQYADLRARGAANRGELAGTNDRKTGSLFVAAVECAAVVAAAPAPSRAALSTFAVELGRAFQILDDLHDEMEDGDPVRGRVTLVTLSGAEAARSRLAEHVAGAYVALDRLPAYPRRLADLVRVIFVDLAGELGLADMPALRPRAEPELLPGQETWP
jgi:geranylgeranyl diphosphate synthase type II